MSRHGSYVQRLPKRQQSLWLQAVQDSPCRLQRYRQPGTSLDLGSGNKSLKKQKLTISFFFVQNFRGQHGKAYLFHSVVNVTATEAVERNMTTGRHIVRDISCRQCREVVGWKYDKAFETVEKYKEGKYILEEELLCVVG